MKITAASLRDLSACSDQVALFAELHPDGIDLPAADPERQEVLDAAGRAGLYVAWWLCHAGESGIEQAWYLDGLLRQERHYRDGRLYDTADGTAAVREWYPSGPLAEERRYRNGLLHDAEDGTAAVQEFFSNGKMRDECHYRDGMLIEEDS